MASAPIAVIGMSGRYPGGANNLDQLWANLKAGVDGISDLPEGRWDSGYQHPDRDRKGRSYTFAAGYLDAVDGFDAEFFGMSPREVQQMDPQHRLLLELAWEALEQAHIVPAQLAGSRTGVFVGLSSRDYADFGRDSGIDAYTNIGVSFSLASNRISYALDLKGPSFTVDTACSSGMVALHQARLAILAGECEMALVGAANLLLSPRAAIGFAKASMLSPASRCTSFDANGAGFVRAEGGGMLLLKPLDAAERDGDDILGVLLSSGVNSDGRTVGISLPSMEAQAALLEQVYGQAGIAPSDVYYLEAHGTGTAVGDPIECEAIARVLGGDKRGSEPLRMGSIKSNIGHLEPAAGIAGLTKVLLAMKHGELPANLHFNTPNPKIDFEGWKLKVVNEATPLPQRDQPLLMGVNSFGFGGTNGHAVLQQYKPMQPRPSAGGEASPQADKAGSWRDMLVLSGQSEAALQAAVEQWQPLLQDAAAQECAAKEGTAREGTAMHWANLRANALHGRTQHEHRLVMHAASAQQALDALAARASELPRAGLAQGKAPVGGVARTAWVYGGNGPQWWGMGREMLAQDATYRAAVEAVDAIFQPLAGFSLVAELLRDAATTRMAQTEVAQPTLFALQVGLTSVLRAAGLQPDAVFGHSVGEVAAAWASGALSLEQAVLVIHQRSAAQATTAGLGKMAALGVPADQAQKLIDDICGSNGGWLELAAVNSPAAVTVAGEPALLDELVQRLTDAGAFARVLALDYAFHTRAMDGIRARLASCLQGLSPAAAQVPFISTVEGHAIEGAALDAAYWWRNVREPVAFLNATEHALQALGITGFIEVGPHPVLRDYLLQCAKARSANATVLTTLRRPRAEKPEPEMDAMWQSICAAYAAGMGLPVKLAPPPRRRIALPLYPWQRSRHWRGENPLPETRKAARREHPLLGWRSSPAGTLWENLLDTHQLGYLLDHVVEDAAIFPGAGYLELGLAAARQLHGDQALQLEDVDFLKPMVLADKTAPMLLVRVDAADGSYEINTRANLEATDLTLHSRGRLTLAESAHRPAAIDIQAVWNALPLDVDAATHYAVSARRGLRYGTEFQGVQNLRVSSFDDESLSAAAWIALPQGCLSGADSYLSHPATLDACLQVLITLLGQREARACAYIPVRVDRLRWFAPVPAKVFCTVHVGRQSERSGSARFTLYDEAGNCVLVLDNTRFQKVDFASAGSAMRLTEHWQRCAQPGASVAAAIALPAPAALLQAVASPWASVEVAQAGPDFDRLAGLYAAQTLRALWAIAGFDMGASSTEGALQRRSRVVAEQAPLFRALVDMAMADGWLRSDAQGLRFGTAELPSTAALWHQMSLQSSAHIAELMLLAQLGENLPALLRGEAQPLLPQASERGNPAFEALLDTAPFSATAHALAAQAVAALLAAWPAGRTLRVLEVHAGGGGLTAAVLPVLPQLRSAYMLSDSDEDVVERLAQRHAAATQVQTMKLDLCDAAAVAAQAGAYDLVLCGDGLQAAAHGGLGPAQALARVRELLVPGGLLLLVASEPTRLSTLLFGQDPDWWHQEATPLLAEQAWAAPFAAAGFDALASRAEPASGHRLWLANCSAVLASPAGQIHGEPAAPVGVLRHWLLLADGSESGRRFAGQVAATLEQQGQQVRTEWLGAQATAVDDTAAFAAWLNQPVDRVVQLAGLTQAADDVANEASNSAPNSAAAQMSLQRLRCEPVLTLLRAMKQEGPGTATRSQPKLHVVTHGALMSPAAGASTVHPQQAPLWGLTRVLANEHAEMAPRLTDLHGPLNATLAQRLAQELLREDAETEVLLDATGRWLRRLAYATPATLALQAQGWPTPAGAPDAAMGERMAVRLEAAAAGGLDALHLREMPRRAPGTGEVEVAVRAAGLNFRDVLWAMNMLPEEAVEAGFSGATVGMECAGVVVAVGVGVQGLAVGDRVIGFASGCFASHVTTEAAALCRIPADLGFEAAATIPTTFLTAMYALDHLARLEPGERVLIHGAAGGVGLAAVQIAKLRGAVVFGTAGNDDKRRLLRLYGVDHVLDSRTLAYADDVMALTQGEGVDVVLNSLAGEAITKNLQILRPFGRMLEIGKRDFYANSRIGLRPFRQNLSYFGIDADTLLVEKPVLARKIFAQVAQLFANAQLHPLPFQALPIQRAAQAFRLMQQSRHVGKIVVTVPAQAAAMPRGLPPLWRADSSGTYLVTGGLGGFGLATAKWLVAQGARHLALLSRSGAVSEEAQAGIAALEAAGAKVQAYAADVSQRSELERVLTQVRANMPALRGVVHSAMVLDDGPLLSQDGERLRRSLQPKLMGAWHLHELTQADALSEFIVYSSATTVVGNPGQGNYVAANLYLETLVQLRRTQGLPGLAIAWGAIKDVGVLTRHQGVEQLLQQRTGMSATPSEQALAELGRMLAAQASVVSVAQFNVQRLGELMAGTRTPRFAKLAPKGAGDAAGAARQTLAERMAGTPAEERRDLVIETLREQLGRILGTAAAKIDLARQLPDLGLDSLMAVELAQSLEAEVGRPVSVMQMIQSSSAVAVADLLLAGFADTANV